jgi:toxin-antitoxin system PIN domain toxin
MKKISSDLVLLDLNVLFALAWPNHQFHAVSTRRMEVKSQRWATCALTQLGFIRLSCNSAVTSSPKLPYEAACMLGAMIDEPLHVYLESLPIPNLEIFKSATGHKQITDAYLLDLARRHDATFLTFDAKLRVLAGTRVRTEVLGS